MKSCAIKKIKIKNPDKWLLRRVGRFFYLPGNRSQPPPVPTLRRGNLFLTKAAPIKGTGVALYVPTPERGNEI